MADEKDNVVDFAAFQKKIEDLESQLNEQRKRAEQRASSAQGQPEGEALKKLVEAYQAFLPSKEELSDMMGQLAEVFQQAADQARDAQKTMDKEEGEE